MPSTDKPDYPYPLPYHPLFQHGPCRVLTCSAVTYPHKLYVAGPMTGIPHANYPAFHAASKQLRDVGYAVLNPAENYAGHIGLTHADYMRLDIQMVLLVDGVAVLPGWRESKGASLEVHIADTLGIQVQTIEEWVDYANPR
jgi:Domain of unknown function (DUF4406)